MCDIFLRGRLDRHIQNFALVCIEGAIGETVSDRLEAGLVGLAGLRIGPAGGCEAVNNQIHLSEVGFDSLDGLLLDLVGKGIAVDAFGVESGFVSRLLKGNRVIPTGTGGFALHRRALEKDAQRRRIVTESRSNPCRESVAGGSADDQYLFRPALLLGGPGHLYLLSDTGFTAFRVCGHTDKSTDLWLNNHNKYLGPDV